jgi:S-adenosylmethionine decarboxylase
MTGCEWVIEAHGCDPVCLSHLESMRKLFDTLVNGMDLHPVQPALWHQFPPTLTTPGGITGLLLLSESHLACHTFPEFSSICINVFCCKPRPEYDFKAALESLLNAETVTVRKLERPYSA